MHYGNVLVASENSFSRYLTELTKNELFWYNKKQRMQTLVYPLKRNTLVKINNRLTRVTHQASVIVAFPKLRFEIYTLTFSLKMQKVNLLHPIDSTKYQVFLRQGIHVTQEFLSLYTS